MIWYHEFYLYFIQIKIILLKTTISFKKNNNFIKIYSQKSINLIIIK